jgi:hypothetical protein
MQFLIHIGVNKTGTSSLQLAFHERRAELSKQGILYPTTGIQSAAHHGISRVIRGAAAADQGMPDDWEDRLRAEFGDHELCILSSENFATVTDPSPLARICPPGQTRIVIYLRDYASYMASWYQQALHSRNISMSISDFIDNHSVSFSEIIERWSQVYGRGNVIVRHFDRNTLKNHDIVADFCDLVRPGLETVFEGMVHDSNPSLTGNLLFFKRMLNCFITREESMEIAFEIGALTTLDPTFRGKLEVGSEMLSRIRFLTREDAAAIRIETKIDLAGTQTKIKGSASPDLDRLASDLALIQGVIEKRNFVMAKYVERMAPLAAFARTTPSSDEAIATRAQDKAQSENLHKNDSETEAMRDLARTLFAVQPDNSDALGDKTKWNVSRSEYVAMARRLMRRLSADGYFLSKND